MLGVVIVVVVCGRATVFFCSWSPPVFWIFVVVPT